MVGSAHRSIRLPEDDSEGRERGYPKGSVSVSRVIVMQEQLEATRQQQRQAPEALLEREATCQ